MLLLGREPAPHHEAWHRLWNAEPRSALTAFWQSGKTSHLAARCLWELGRDPAMVVWTHDGALPRAANELWRRAPAVARAVFPNLFLKLRARDLYDMKAAVPRMGPNVMGAKLLALDDAPEDAWVPTRDRLLASGARCLAVGQARPDSLLGRLEAQLGYRALSTPAVTPAGEPTWGAEWPLGRLAEQERALAAEPVEYARRFLLDLSDAPVRTETKDGDDLYPVWKEYAHDPVRFAHDMFGVELWDRLPNMKPEFSSQADVARALAKHRWVAVRSGNKVGKSWVGACLALWWACTRAGSLVILTAPTSKQVDVIWGAIQELYRMHAKKRDALGVEPRIPIPATQASTGIRWPDGRKVWGRTADKQENFQGPSSLATLVIADEAIGVKAHIYRAILSIVAAEGAAVFAISNPNHDSGWWAEAFRETDKWSCHHMSILQSPTYLGDRPVPGLGGRKWVETEVPAGSQEYEVMVMGEFPTVGSDQVVALRDVEAGKARWDSAPDDGPDLVMGLDVARFGDDRSVVCARRGLRLYTPQWFRDHGEEAVARGKDSDAVTGMLVRCMRLLRRSGERVRIMVDATGGWGTGPAALIKQMKENGTLDQRIDVVEVNFGAGSEDPKRWMHKRDELMFKVRIFLREQDGAMYPDAELGRELQASRYSITPSGALKVEPKKDVKKRVGRSPDLADAAALAVYDGSAAIGEEFWHWAEEAQRGMPLPAGGL